jgi:hypothetical protein
VELVMAIVVLFIAMAAATQIIVSMVAATMINRHVDLAMSVATQTMENSVAYDCGGQLLDPAATELDDLAERAATQVFYSTLQKRCLIDTNSTPAANSADEQICKDAKDAPNDPFNDKFLPAFEQQQNDLGSRRFTVRKSAAAFNKAADGSATGAGTLPMCTTLRLTWKFITATGVNTVDDGSNNSVRLQRDVHVQWFEPRQTTVRFRNLTQISALPPDAKVAVNQGRISVVAGPTGSATIKMLNSDSPQRFVTYAADSNTGLVIFPFLPDGSYELSTAGSTLLVTLGPALRSVCARPNISPVPFTSACKS